VPFVTVMGRPRTIRVWTRLGGEEYESLRRVKERIGVATDGEALRFLVQLSRSFFEREWVMLPPPEWFETYLRIYGERRHGKKEKYD